MRSYPKLTSASELHATEHIADQVYSVYQSLGADDLVKLETLYSEDVHFEDPAHALQGRKQLMDYFTSLPRISRECA